MQYFNKEKAQKAFEYARILYCSSKIVSVLLSNAWSSFIERGLREHQDLLKKIFLVCYTNS